MNLGMIWKKTIIKYLVDFSNKKKDSMIQKFYLYIQILTHQTHIKVHLYTKNLFKLKKKFKQLFFLCTKWLISTVENLE